LGPCIYAMLGYANPLARTEPFWENRSKKKTRKHKHSYVNNNKRYIDCGILTIINGGRCLSTLERSSSSCAILRQSHSLNFTQLWYYQITCFFNIICLLPRLGFHISISTPGSKWLVIGSFAGCCDSWCSMIDWVRFLIRAPRLWIKPVNLGVAGQLND